jgi:NAD(P)-dependent dehydrogenase (short-subunit alcohol dehydrogenase family)
MSKFTHSILVTGGTSGLGFHAAAILAKQFKDAKVIIAARKDPELAAAKINKKNGQNNVEFLSLDLGKHESIRAFVKTLKDQQLPPISHLLLNAGLQFPGEMQYTSDGIEATFGINHVGHALLFHLLQPSLADECRIVVVSSGTHDPAQKSGLPDAIYNTAEELAHPKGESLKYVGRQRYATSKLCNVLWTYALSRRVTRLPGKKITVVAFDPGLMPGTGLAREAGPFLRFLWHHVLPVFIPILQRVFHPNVHTPHESGANLAFVAADSSVTTKSGVYYEMRKEIPSSIDSYIEAKQEELWAWTVRTLASTEQERKEFEIVG